MYRGIFAIAASLSNLDIKFVSKSVGQTGKSVNKETVGPFSSTNNVLTITSPLISNIKRAVFNLRSQSNNIVLASMIRTYNIYDCIYINRNHNIVGNVGVSEISCYLTGNRILACSVTAKRKCRASGIGIVVVHHPYSTSHRFATAIFVITQTKNSLIARTREAQVLRLRRGHLHNRFSIHGFNIHGKRLG